MVDIRFIFKLDFPLLVGEEKPIARCVQTATIQFVRLENLPRTEVAQAAAEAVNGVVIREFGHEAPEVFHPGIVLIPVEQVDCPLIHLLRFIVRETPVPLVAHE